MVKMIVTAKIRGN